MWKSARAIQTSTSSFALLTVLGAVLDPRTSTAEPPVKGVVVIDVTRSGPQQAGRSVWPASPIWVTAATDSATLDALKVKLDAFEAGGTLADEAEYLQTLTSLPHAADPTRMVSKAGDQVLLVLLADHGDGHEPVAVVKETKRLTQLAQDLQKLVTAVATAKRTRGLGAGPTIQVVVQRITLAERRATVTIAARSDPKGTGSRTISEDSCKNGDCVQRVVTVNTGPAELLFLSLDLPVTKATDLVYDAASGTVQPQTTPTVAFLGFDVAFGDILTRPRSVGWQNFVAKAFIKLSSSPSDAFGFGLGFRPPALDLGGFKLDLFQVFGAYVWTKQDSVASPGVPDLSSSYKGTLRGGVSFNLDKLADWLKL